MFRHATIAVRMALATLVMLGVVYPLVITGFAHLLCPQRASGSLVRQGGRVVGSALIGQPFTRPEYFHPRPSAAGSGYDGLASGGTNFGPSSRKLEKAVQLNIGHVRAENPGLPEGRIPADMVCASASGLDPDISVANACAQIPRVARARRLPEAAVRRLVLANVTDRQFGLLGERRVNVLRLNLALDGMHGASAR